ncbi:MAG: hypothetical protein Ct9H300mP22_0080 [Gammaproteobacteria bacterium]|nr:MAG: hypothetical protein Ct9H300mP22_0080 [Gammaproteobacteria bacterium]
MLSKAGAKGSITLSLILYFLVGIVGTANLSLSKTSRCWRKIVDFAGWDMPINYGPLIEEHNQVRTAAGVFDVSHMAVVDVGGKDAEKYLRYLLANDVAKLDEVGRALYSAMLNHDGHVLDDLIVYRMSFGYRLVVNCATRGKDLRWMIQNTDGYAVSIQERPRLAILAVHGPESINKVCEVVEEDQTNQIRD